MIDSSVSPIGVPELLDGESMDHAGLEVHKCFVSVAVHEVTVRGVKV